MMKKNLQTNKKNELKKEKQNSQGLRAAMDARLPAAVASEAPLPPDNAPAA